MDGQFRGHEVRFAKDGGYGNVRWDWSKHKSAQAI